MTDKTIIQKLQEPLKAEDVEARVGTCNENGFSLLLYKTARTDMHRLDEVCKENWCNKHYVDSKGNIVCKIGIRFAIGDDWIYREDTGSESMTEKEKGAYSDSFKRAGFRWGIGRELYDSPFIWVDWEMEDKRKSGATYPKWLPKKLFASNIKITGYKVEKGEVLVRISYKGTTLFNSKQGKE